MWIKKEEHVLFYWNSKSDNLENKFMNHSIEVSERIN